MAESTLLYRQPHRPLATRVDDLLGRMTLEEKIDQLHQCGIGDTNPNNLAQRADQFRPTYGSYIVGGPWQTLLETRNALQKRAVDESRLGIPALFASDVIHGYRTIFPIPLAQACSWNPDLVREACRLAAAEAKAHGIDWTFAPMVDHCVDPRWGRIAETFGESPYASARFAVASIEGYQGRNFGPGAIAACLKHYVGYGASEGGRDYVYTEISDATLWERHLPPFEAGVRAGVRSVMSAFNDLNGIPTSAHRYTLTELLRARWGLTGPVVSDWASVAQLINQGFVANGAEAAEKAFNAGVDIDMADGLYREHLPALVQQGRVALATIDEAVRRVLRLKFELGLFESPYTKKSPLTAPASPPGELLAHAEELAARSLVLLKNDGVLPLSSTTIRIALLGPLADHAAPLLGCWAQQGQPDETESIAAALRARLPAAAELLVERGCSITGESPADFSSALTAARTAQVVILCVGEEATMSGENASRTTLRLAGQQEPLIEACVALGKPVILVVVSGRPLELHRIEPKLAAIISLWGGGSRAAAALADTLLGRRNPSGRLALTWPRTSGQIPLYHQLRPRARTGDEGAYRDLLTTPQYEFGHGLSYTTFAYSPIQLSHHEIRRGETLRASLRVSNRGNSEGVETIFWFIRDPAASRTRPLKELKYFEQITLLPGEERAVHFDIDPLRDLAFPDTEGHPVLESGEIILLVGPHRASFHVLV